ncbi:O-antigen ligase family protein [Bacillus sp. JJ1521]|uniref:O-antigen ligase family protein n=1 Tax=Bacillus sp. JJ1521 TaxID=3122957 RepID=UPI002FFF05B2
MLKTQWLTCLPVQLALTVGFVYLLSKFSFSYISESNIPLMSLVVVLLCIGLIGFVFYKNLFWVNSTFLERLVSLLLITSFLGSGLLAVPVGPISIFPFRLILMLLVALTVIYIVNRGPLVLMNEIRVMPIILFILSWLCIGLLSISWSISWEDGIKEIIYLTTGILVVFYVTFLYKGEMKYVEFYYIWVLMTILLVGIGYINYLFQYHLPVSRINNVYDYQKSIPTAVFTNENDFASFLSISIFFFVALIMNGKVPILKIIGLLGIPLITYLILVTSSRANLLAVMLGLLFWFFFILRNRQKMIVLYGAMILFVLANLLFTDQLSKVYALGFEEIHTLIEREETGNSVDIRENLLKNVAVFVGDTLGFGVGAGNAEYYMKNFQVYETFHNYNVHNWWAEIAVHYGVFIFIGYILLFIYLIYKLYRINRETRNRNYRMISEALSCALVAFSLASISPNSFMALNYNWVLIAFSIGFINYYFVQSREDQDEKYTESNKE